MCFAYKLNKQGNNITTSLYSFLNFEPVFPYKFLTVASWPAYRFLRRLIRWPGIPISLNFLQFVMIHTVKDFSIISETEVDVFLEFLCFVYDPADVDNFISDSAALSKPILYIWKFLFTYCWNLYFVHNLTSMRNEYNCPVVWIFFSTALLGNWDKGWPFPVLWPLLVFPNLLTYWVQHFNSITF